VGWVLIGPSPRRTGQPATAFSDGAVARLSAPSFVVPVDPLSCRYFVQSAALTLVAAAIVAAAMPMTANIELMQRKRIDPPQVGEVAVIADGFAEAMGERGDRGPAQHPLRLRAIEHEAPDVGGTPLAAQRLDGPLHLVADETEDLVHRDLAPTRDVEGLA